MNAYHRPTDLVNALAILSRMPKTMPKTMPVTLTAGCTDLFAATEAQVLPGAVLDLTAIAELRGVRQTPDGWRIGATTTWSDIIAADLPAGFDMLKQAAAEVGSVQIQNAGTIAGNLCNASPAADGVPPLLALDASVELASAKGVRCLPLAKFLLGVRRTALAPDEMVSAVLIPKSAGFGRSKFLKLGARKFLVISIAMVAVRVVEDRGRVQEIAISIGSCSAVALRLSALEAHLTGGGIADMSARINKVDLAAVLSPITDVRGDVDYRITAATELLRRVLDDISKAST